MRLLPRRNSSAAQPDIECEIFHISLSNPPNNRPSYEALSYVWGSASKPFRILADNCHLAVTSNLYIALQYLRMNIDRPKILWIDSICINQNDIVERNRQVSIMRHIFLNANRTIVWLGDFSFEPVIRSDDFLAFIESEHGSEAFLAQITGRRKNSLLSNVLKIFDCAWFTRIWIVQELTLSKDVVVRIGEREIGWDRLVSFMNSVTRLVWQSLTAVAPENSATASPTTSIQRTKPHNIFLLDRQRRRWRSEEGPEQLLYLVFDFCDFKFSESLDKVYALAGVASQESYGKTNNMKIDYKVDFGTMVMELLRYHAASRPQSFSQSITDRSSPVSGGHANSTLSTIEEHLNLYPYKQDHRICNPELVPLHQKPTIPYVLRGFVVGEVLTPIGWLRLIYMHTSHMFCLLAGKTDGTFYHVESFRTSEAHEAQIGDYLTVFKRDDSLETIDDRLGATVAYLSDYPNSRKEHRRIWSHYIVPVFFEENIPKSERLLTAGQQVLWAHIMQTRDWNIMRADGSLSAVANYEWMQIKKEARPTARGLRRLYSMLEADDPPLNTR